MPRSFVCIRCHGQGRVVFDQVDDQEPLIWAYICQSQICQHVYVEYGVYRAAALETGECEIADPEQDLLEAVGLKFAVTPSSG